MASDNFTQRTDSRQNRIQSFAFVIAGGLCVVFSVGFAASGLLRVGQSCEISLDERINPNDASTASLARLPGIGIVRAEAIVTYRDDFSGKNGNGPVFRDCNDLQNVNGIGPKTTGNISKWLKFK